LMMELKFDVCAEMWSDLILYMLCCEFDYIYVYICMMWCGQIWLLYFLFFCWKFTVWAVLDSAALTVGAL
jgi:hypothetical protein